MKRRVLALVTVLCLAWTCLAETSSDDAPATKADVERYLQVVNSHDLMKKIMSTMTQGMHQMWHEQYLKHKGELPDDYEAKMKATMDDMFDNMPMDEIVETMVPAYQKHLTKGDIDNLVAFYSSPTGAKVLREMPAIMAEATQDMIPTLSKYVETVRQKLQKQTDDMIARSKKPSDAAAPASNN